MKFRKKPVVIDAMQLDEKNSEDCLEFIGRSGRIQTDWQGAYLMSETLEGVMTATPDDWIIKGVKGEFYPCKPDIFDATYEQVEDETNVT